MKRLITFLLVFILGFSVVFIGVNAKAEVLPNEDAKDWEFEGLGIVETFENGDFDFGSVQRDGFFSTNFNAESFEFEIKEYTITFQLEFYFVGETPTDYNASPNSLYINGVEILKFNGTFFVYTVGQNRYTLILTETAPPNFSKTVTLNNSSNFYYLEFDTSWDWYYYDIINADLNIYLYPSESSLANQLYWEGYADGRDYGYQKGKDEGYQLGLDEGYQLGKDEGYELGKADGIALSSDYSFAGLIGQVFVGLGSLLAINLLPGISLGAIVAVPVVFGIIAFILGKRGGKDD